MTKTANKKHVLHRIYTVILIVLLTACGGGGCDENPAVKNYSDTPVLAPNVRSLVIEGDSLSDKRTTSTWPITVQNQSTWTNTNWFDDAVGGTTTTQMLARYMPNVHPLRPGIPGNGIYIINGGTNDLRYGLGDAASTYANLVQLWAQARADGFKVIATTVHSSRNPAPTLDPAVVESYRITLNQLIRSNPALYDGLIELDKVFTNLDDTTLLYDQVHYTPAGNALVVTAVQNAITALGMQ